MFIRQHPIAALWAATALQIAGVLILFVAGIVGSHGLRIGAFTIAVIGALLGAAVLVFLARTRGPAWLCMFGAVVFVGGAAFEVSFALLPGTPHWIGFLVIAAAAVVIPFIRDL